MSRCCFSHSFVFELLQFGVGLTAREHTCRHYQGLLDQYSAPKEGTKELHFDDKYPKSLPVQFSAIFTKYMAVYWRMPEYNGTRFFLALAVGFIFGAIFWRLGDRL